MFNYIEHAIWNRDAIDEIISESQSNRHSGSLILAVHDVIGYRHSCAGRLVAQFTCDGMIDRAQIIAGLILAVTTQGGNQSEAVSRVHRLQLTWQEQAVAHFVSPSHCRLCIILVLNMPEQSKVAQPEWTDAQLSILNKYLPGWLEDKKTRKHVRSQAWQEIKPTLTKDMAEGVVPDGIEQMYTVRK